VIECLSVRVVEAAILGIPMKDTDAMSADSGSKTPEPLTTKYCSQDD